MIPGLLISFEGSEGCGKSTQIQRLKTGRDMDHAVKQQGRRGALDAAQWPDALEQQNCNLVEERRYALQS